MRRRKTATIYEDAGLPVIVLGGMDIWDPGDLVCLHQALYDLVEFREHRSIGIDMSCVKHLPVGYFGLLCDLYEAGIDIQLFAPQPRVQHMIWFRKVFGLSGAGRYGFLQHPNQLFIPRTQTGSEWLDRVPGWRLTDEKKEDERFDFTDAMKTQCERMGCLRFCRTDNSSREGDSFDDNKDKNFAGNRGKPGKTMSGT